MTEEYTSELKKIDQVRRQKILENHRQKLKVQSSPARTKKVCVCGYIHMPVLTANRHLYNLIELEITRELVKIRTEHIDWNCSALKYLQFQSTCSIRKRSRTQDIDV